MARILVTGANRGLGLEFARQLVERGDRVIATCRKPAQAQELNRLAMAHPGRLTLLPVDLAKPASIDALAAEVPLVCDALDGLVNNAGTLHSGERFGHLEAKPLVDALAVNAVGTLLMMQAMTTLLAAGESPRIMNISSILGSIASRDAFNTPGYAISKAALNMATRLAAFELSAKGVVAFAVHPGWVRTDMGGPKAEIEPAEAVAALLALFDRASAAHAGGFYDREGRTLPW